MNCSVTWAFRNLVSSSRSHDDEKGKWPTRHQFKCKTNLLALFVFKLAILNTWLSLKIISNLYPLEDFLALTLDLFFTPLTIAPCWYCTLIHVLLFTPRRGKPSYTHAILFDGSVTCFGVRLGSSFQLWFLKSVYPHLQSYWNSICSGTDCTCVFASFSSFNTSSMFSNACSKWFFLPIQAAIGLH